MRSERWTRAEKYAAESLYEQQLLGAKFGYNEIPSRPTYPGAQLPVKELEAKSWETVTVEEMVSSDVRDLLKN